MEQLVVGSQSSVVGTRVGAVVLGTALVTLAAQISVPLPGTPVPMTLQPLAVLLVGGLLGARLGAASMVLYLALGIAGLPVFTPTVPLLGIARLLGPTGGYLLAYPLAAYVTGWLAARGFDRRYLTSMLAMLAGLVTVFAGGVLWLAYFAPGTAGHPVGLRAALAAGLYPFVIPDLIKVALASAVLPSAWKLMRRL